MCKILSTKHSQCGFILWILCRQCQADTANSRGAILVLKGHSAVKGVIQLTVHCSSHKRRSTLYKPHRPRATIMCPVLFPSENASLVKSRTSFSNHMLDYQSTCKLPWDDTAKCQAISQTQAVQFLVANTTQPSLISKRRRELAGRMRECRQLKAGGTEGGCMLRTQLKVWPGHSVYNVTMASSAPSYPTLGWDAAAISKTGGTSQGTAADPKPQVGMSNWSDFSMCLTLTTSILGEQVPSSLPEPAPSTKTGRVSVSRHRKGVQTLAAGKQNEGTRNTHRKSQQSTSDKGGIWTTLIPINVLFIQCETLPVLLYVNIITPKIFSNR